MKKWFSILTPICLVIIDQILPVSDDPNPNLKKVDTKLSLQMSSQSGHSSGGRLVVFSIIKQYLQCNYVCTALYYCYYYYTLYFHTLHTNYLDERNSILVYFCIQFYSLQYLLILLMICYSLQLLPLCLFDGKFTFFYNVTGQWTSKLLQSWLIVRWKYPTRKMMITTMGRF